MRYMDRFRIVNDNGEEEEVLAKGETIHEALLEIMRSGYESGLMVNCQDGNIREKVDGFYEGTEELRLEVVTYESHEITSDYLTETYDEMVRNP